MKELELSPRAERSLSNISTFSREHYGNARGRRNVVDMLKRCRQVAAGRLSHQSCRDFFADDLNEDLRFVRTGSHFAVFVDRGNRILIVDFLHQSADIGNRLEGPQE